MNLGGEAADQVVRYSIEGLDHGLRLSGTMAKNLAVFFAAVLKSNKKSWKNLHGAYAEGKPATQIFYRPVKPDP